MAGHPLALEEAFDRMGGGPYIKALFDELVGHGVVMTIGLDMVVDPPRVRLPPPPPPRTKFLEFEGIIMSGIDIDDFTDGKECIYKDECYSVRDNGAVFRHQKTGKRLRPNDCKWIFGKESPSNAYLWLSNHQVHRIVATAFHGEPSTPQHVVDHIDTNRKNNRPENLRWLTRLENTLKNPATRKKIEYLCGSIEAFLENPSILRELQLKPNDEWMRTVTPEEAQNAKIRMSIWANKESSSKKNNIW